MPKIHVVYDPTDKLAIKDDNLPAGAKFATVSVAVDVSPEEFVQLGSHLAELLLEQFADGSK